MDDYEVKYFLSHPQFGEKEVTKEEFIKAERAAGFRPKSGRDDVCATGGFSGKGLSGSVRYIDLEQ
ncbi:hypothetical protein [Robertmurraya sp.]|uniref:hypothetical protein n=1 Tax=Robertmurraya sp. TaxID=2837525 RepID=UPI003703C981